MKINFSKISSITKHNLEVIILVSVAVLALVTMQLFNSLKTKKQNNFIDILNNTYFEKTTNYLCKIFTDNGSFNWGYDCDTNFLFR